MKSLTQFSQDLQSKIKNSYLEGVTLAGAESLAGEFLHAQMVISAEIKSADLDTRMRKTGLKSVRAAAYTNAAVPIDGKKPTEAAIAATVELDEAVTAEQDGFDTAEVDRDELERLYNIAREAHIYFRGIAKGRFE